MQKQIIQLTSCLFASLALWLSTDLTLTESLAVGTFLYALAELINNLGHRLIIPELISTIACLELLLIPVLFYGLDPDFMPVESGVYFNYALPATIALQLGLSYWNRQTEPNHSVYMARVKAYLNGKPSVGLTMIAVGIVTTLLGYVSPPAFKNLFNLLSSALYIGVLYTIYSNSRYKFVAIVLALFVLFYNAVREGMFGELVFWLVLYGVIFLVSSSRKITLPAKVGLMVLGLSVVLLIQSVKMEYRMNTWGLHADERSSDPELMGALLADRIQNLQKLVEPLALFNSTTRFNQGALVGYTMRHVPSVEPYANGEVLLSLLIPLVPRVLWTNKPITGGRANIERFTPVNVSDNTSVNISPAGEGYVNFGYGGILFMFLYGFLFGFIFYYTLYRSSQLPTLVLWLPKLFINCLTMETDLLSTWGSMLNMLLLVSLFYWAGRKLMITV